MPTLLHHRYVLAVHDVKQAARFYIDALGFKVVAEPPGWVFVLKGDCMIMLGECPDDLHPSKLGCHSYFAYLHVDDADAVRAQIIASGLGQVREIRDQPWGMREFAVTTPDGHRLTIGHKIP